MHTLSFLPYDPKEEVVPSANGDFALRDAAAFRWLHQAYFSRDEQGRPTVPLNTERLDDAVDLTRAFKRLREGEEIKLGPEPDDVRTVFRLRGSGGDMELSKDALKLLRDHWQQYVKRFLGSSDAELVVAMRERFEWWDIPNDERPDPVVADE
jgi:hypothetical protein